MNDSTLASTPMQVWKSLQDVTVVGIHPGPTHEHAHARRMDPPIQQRRPAAGAGPYQAYKPLPFTPAERGQVTILFGGLNWRTERAMQGVLENLGYKAMILPPATRADLLIGRELADSGQCCPTSFNTGALANFLRGECQRLGAGEVERRYIYLTAGTCGACRFGQYHSSYELALRNLGLDGFRMYLFRPSDLEQAAVPGGGLDFGLPFTLGLLWAMLATDLVRDLEFRVRPYEVRVGETDRVGREAVDYLYEVFRRQPRRGKRLGLLAWHLATDYFTAALREVRQRFDRIEVDRLRVKPVVKITGEFYLKLVEGEANYNLHRWLEEEGAEVYPSMASMMIDYFWRFDAQDAEEHIGLRRGARRDLARLALCRWVLKLTYARMRRALGDAPHAQIDQEELKRLASPWYHCRLDGGEGDMLVGQALWSHLNAKAHMVCELSPYACMPNTMSIGAMAAVLGKYPDLLYAPIEIKGDAEVHAYSRCQMILTEAKRRAQDEFSACLERTGLSEATFREMVAARPELRRATYALPHYGVAGTAANLVLHVAAGRRT